jgi:hypothetical protein
MTLIPFAPPPGLFTDDTEFSSDGKWIEGSNVRSFRGRMQPIGGWLRRIASTVAGTGRRILEWRSSAGTTYVAYATTSGLYIETASTLYDITPGGGTVSTTAWSLQTYGDILLANFPGNPLYQWQLNTAVDATEVTQSPDNITAILVTPERQVLALGCNEEVSGTFNGMCIRGSDIEDITDWTSLTTNNAFEHILEGSGKIITGRMVGPYVAVWTDRDLFVGQFIGDPSQTYRFEKVGQQCGCIGLSAVTVVDQTAYWIAPDLQFYAWTPGAPPKVMDCPVIGYFQGNLNTTKSIHSRSYAAYVAKFGEVWFVYPTGTSSTAQPGAYISFSTLDGKWSKGELARRAMHQGINNVIAIDSAGNLLNCETGSYGDSTSAVTLSWSLESADYYLNNAQDRVMMRSVWPDFEDQAGNISLVLKTREYPQGAEVTQPTLTLTTSTTKKNFRASGRMIRAIFSGTDGGANTATFCRFGKLTFDAVKVGQR